MAEAAHDTRELPRFLRAYAVHAAAAASSLSVLLFWRAPIANDLGLIGALAGESVIIGVAFVASALLAARTRNALPATVIIWLGSLASAVGLALAAWTIELGLFTIGAVLVGLGTGPAAVLHRLILAVQTGDDDRHRALSWYWGSVAIGALIPLAIDVVADPSPDTLLWLAFAAMCIAAALLSPHALVHDDDINAVDSSGLLDVPWVRRSRWAAFGLGAAVVGGAHHAQAHLLGEWQRSNAQMAAVLAAGLASAVAISWFGPWYHRLERFRGSRRSDAIGLQLLGVGALTFVGALSFTYIGLIVSFSLAGGLAALAAASLDAATYVSVRPELRRQVAAGQVIAAAVGAGVGLAITDLVVSGWSSQLKLAILGIPLVVVGLAVRRFADPPPRRRESAETEATTVPRRIEQLDDTTPLLRVEGVDVAYGDVQVLFDVELTVGQREVVALLGTNGAGKTTLLRTISGLEPILDGRITFAGLNITRTRPTWRVGMGLHQIVGGEAVVGPFTVAENLQLFAHGVKSDDRDARIADALELFPRLAERLNQRAATLSGGEKQMLALAKALIVEPRLLLIDEFSLGLAPTVIADLLPVVRTIADRGTSVLLVEQSVNIALSIADRAYVIEKGTIGYEGSAETLRSKPELIESAYLKGLAEALDQ